MPKRLLLLCASALLVAACGGDVANGVDTSGGGASPGTQSAAPSNPCSGGTGSDPSVTTNGAADNFSEGASAAPVGAAGGLQYVDLAPGAGTPIAVGQCITMQYTGWLADGTKFDSSKDRTGGFPVAIGTGQVIKGWDQGIPGMKLGGRRRLIIPPSLGYGATANGKIPANSTLIFLVEVVRVY